MKIFNKILRFKKQQIQDWVDRRDNFRYEPAEDCLLTAQLKIQDDIISCRIIDISFDGIRLFLAQYLPFILQQKVTIYFTLGEIRIDMCAYVCHINNMTCGFNLSKNSFDDLHNYVQAILPICIGKSLKELASDRVGQTDPNHRKRVFLGELSSSLTFWVPKYLPTESEHFEEFEFKVEDFAIRGKTSNQSLEIFVMGDESNKKIHLANVLNSKQNREENLEISHFFARVVINIHNHLPTDIVEYLESFIESNSRRTI